MVTASVRSFLAEPRVPDPPARGWRDVALVGALMTAAVAESIFRPDVSWRPVATVVALLVFPVLLWRRSHPLLATAVGFGGALALHLSAMVGDVSEVGLDSMAGIIVLPYALYRWASGRDALIGTVLVAVPAGLGLAASQSVGDRVGGTAVLVTAFALGAAMRDRAAAHGREVQQVRTVERGELARELHDTVAHHVSAIAIQAQAGRAVAAADPAAAVAALAVIEAEATRTLSEMRTMVRVLRDGDEVEYAPQRGISDLDELTRMSPLVGVQCTGDLAGLPQPVEATVYRICQESVTNAIRHARHATRVAVAVTGEADQVRLTIDDDGSAAGSRSPGGYGLVGMRERASLLGGTVHAGPGAERGWRVEAVLPRSGAPR